MRRGWGVSRSPLRDELEDVTRQRDFAREETERLRRGCDEQIKLLSRDLQQLHAENARLRGALEAGRPLYWDHPSQHLDTLAEEFYRATGIMAPGKSEPLACGARWTDEDRRAAWVTWLDERRAKAGKRADEALSGAPSTEKERPDAG